MFFKFLKTEIKNNTVFKTCVNICAFLLVVYDKF